MDLTFSVDKKLVLPFTDGAGLVYEYVTKPYFAPMAQSIKNKMG